MPEGDSRHSGCRLGRYAYAVRSCICPRVTLNPQMPGLILEVAHTLPCLALRSYVLDGTRTKLPTPVHILAHPASLPELSRKVTFVSRSSHRNIQKMSLEKGVTCFIWFMYLDGKNEQNILFLKMIQIRTNNTRSQSIADPRESGGAAK